MVRWPAINGAHGDGKEVDLVQIYQQLSVFGGVHRWPKRRQERGQVEGDIYRLWNGFCFGRIDQDWDL
jgi:hypothetical protein